MNPKTRDVEARIYEKVKNYGTEAYMYFTQDELAFYTRYIEPTIFLQIRVNVEQGMRRVN